MGRAVAPAVQWRQARDKGREAGENTFPASRHHRTCGFSPIRLLITNHAAADEQLPGQAEQQVPSSACASARLLLSESRPFSSTVMPKLRRAAAELCAAWECAAERQGIASRSPASHATIHTICFGKTNVPAVQQMSCAPISHAPALPNPLHTVFWAACSAPAHVGATHNQQPCRQRAEARQQRFATRGA